jgi:hypothetical protein
MRTRSKLATLALSSTLAFAGFAGIAGPALADDTATTFAITGGALALTVPATANLGAVATGTLIASGALGPVTVADTRGALVNSWATTVTSSAFVTGTSTPAETVTEPNVGYVSGAFTAHSGLGVFVPGTKSPAPLYTGAAGNSSTTWDPTITMTLLSSQVAGAYTGIVTHSVA